MFHDLEHPCTTEALKHFGRDVLVTGLRQLQIRDCLTNENVA